MRTLIKNGLIFDGTGEQAYRKQIIIEDECIAAVTEAAEAEAGEVIDAEGMVVTPGFIDIHRHCDLAALYDPDFGRIEIAQGLTAVIGGNCGLAPIPALPRYKKDIFDFIEPCLGIVPPSMSFEHFSEYMDALAQRRPALSVGSYIGLGSLKAAIKGYGKSPFTKKEIEQARKYISEGMEAGAAGLSIGLMYQPECYSSKEELQEIISAAAPYSKPLTCHIRGEGDHLVSSVREVIGFGEFTGVPVHITHFKATGVKNWGRNIEEAIELVEAARARGQDVTVDFYPYCGGSTTLISLIPPVFMEDSVERTLGKLETQRGREELKRDIYKEHSGWDNMVTAIGWERILISTVGKEGNKGFSGKNFKEASAIAGYEEPSEFMCRLLLEEEGKVGIIVLSMSQDDIDRVARLPYSLVISDALYGVSDCPHPRLYGSFPKILRDYVRERGILKMEEAVRKMTGLPAQRLSIQGKGLIKEGYHGDINIFSMDHIMDYAVFEDPKQLCTGFQRVMIGGKTILLNDEIIRMDCGGAIKI